MRHSVHGSGKVSHVLDEYGFHLARHAQGAHEGAAIGGDNRFFTCGIHLAQQHHIGLAEYLDEILEAVARAAVAVRLECQHQPPARVGAACRSNGGGHFHRMVAVIVDHEKAAAALCGNLPIVLEAPPYPLETGQGAQHGVVGNVERLGNADGRKGVEHVVFAGKVEHNRQIRKRRAVAALHGETHLSVFGEHIHCPNLCVFTHAVSGDRTGDLRQDVAQCRAVDAQHGVAVERHAVQEVDKGLFQVAEVMAVCFHVIGVDVGDYRHDGQQLQERSVGFVGFYDDVFALAQVGIGARAVELAANDESGVQARFGQHAGNQTGGSGFAVRARNGNTFAETHQFGQHERAGNHRNVSGSRRHDFGVISPDGSGGNQHVCALDIFGGMTRKRAHAQIGQAAGGLAGRQVRS